MKPEEIRERMHSGRLYFCTDESLADAQTAALELQYEYNLTRPGETEHRQQLLRQMFAEIGENCCILPPLNANWGGKFAHFGHDVFANFNLTLVDDTEIYVGDNVLFGPNVTLCAGTHPVHIELRRQQAQYNLPIHIGNNVWIGGNTFVMPGVTIGDNSVIGAGSVVTRDVPANVVALGNPCRVLRKIGEQDEKFYDHGREIDL